MLKIKKIILLLMRASLLLVIIILGFTVVFPGWYSERDIILNEIANKFRSKEEIELREQAKRQNISYEDHKANIEEKQKRKELRKQQENNINLAIDIKDSALLRETLLNMQMEKIPTDIFKRVIAADDKELLSDVNDFIPCKTLTTKNSKNIQFNKGAHVNSASRAIQESTNAELIEYWVLSQCYQMDLNFVKNILMKNKESLFESIAYTAETENFWNEVFEQSLAMDKSEFIVEQIRNGFSPIPNSFLLIAIEKGHENIVDVIIESDRSFIRKNGLTEQVVYSFLKIRTTREKPKLRKNIEESILKSELENTLTPEQYEPLLTEVISVNNVNAINILLAANSDIDFSNYIPDQLEPLDRMLTSYPDLLVTLHDRYGLDFTLLSEKGLDQLATAMRSGDVELVEKMLNIGVQPRLLYRTRSILYQKIGGDESSKVAIMRLLKDAGAIEDDVQLAYEFHGKTYDPSCRIGEPSINFNTENYQALIDRGMTESATSRLTAYEVCEISLLSCTLNQNNSLDDCFESTSVCSDDTLTNGLILSNNNLQVSNLCCPAIAKSKYNDLRCAGQSVIESAIALDDFSTVYNVPTILVNVAKRIEP